MSMVKVEICGYITEPEIKYTPDGKKVLTFSVAHNPKKDAEPMWFSCTVWNEKLAESLSWLAKGMGVFVRGHYSDRIYNDKIFRSISVEEIQAFGKNEQPAQEDLPF